MSFWDSGSRMPRSASRTCCSVGIYPDYITRVWRGRARVGRRVPILGGPTPRPTRPGHGNARKTTAAGLERRLLVSRAAVSNESRHRRSVRCPPPPFEGVPHTVSELGLPLLDGAMAHLECITVSAHVEGDHTIFVGRVERMSVPGGEPLLYFKGRYERFVKEPQSGA